MVHVVESKALKTLKNTLFFQHFYFWTMSQFCRHMCSHGHVCGRVWHHLGPLFLPSLPPPSQVFSIFSITIPHWSFLKHLGPSGAHLGQIWCPLGSILVNFGLFWTHWGRTWNKNSYILNEAHENLAFWNLSKHRAPNVSQHE